MKGLKERQDRRLGAFLGLAVGDALGAQVEGLPKGTFPEVREMKGGGPTAFPRVLDRRHEPGPLPGGKPLAAGV